MRYRAVSFRDCYSVRTVRCRPQSRPLASSPPPRELTDCVIPCSYDKRCGRLGHWIRHGNRR